MMKQIYENYNLDDQTIWFELYHGQMSQLPLLASVDYLSGIGNCRFENGLIPNFDDLNNVLSELTGWKVFAVPGLIDNKPFFEHLYNCEFPATTWLRNREQMKYIVEPDMFHDVFGHIPLLTEKNFCGYLKGLGNIGLKYIGNPEVIEFLARIYWYTVEFGLIEENGQTKIYGAGILSSPGESVYSLGKDAVHFDFDVKKIMQTPYIKDKYQSQYFVINSYEQLFQSLTEIEAHIENFVLTGTL